jgi:hypothetical protein
MTFEEINECLLYCVFRKSNFPGRRLGSNQINLYMYVRIL